MVDPLGALALTLTTYWKVAEAPAAKVGMVSVAVAPAEPGVAAGPLVCVSDPKVAFVGVVSLTTTPRASLGPLLVTEIVYVAFMPAVTVAGPVFVTATS